MAKVNTNLQIPVVQENPVLPFLLVHPITLEDHHHPSFHLSHDFLCFLESPCNPVLPYHREVQVNLVILALL